MTAHNINTTDITNCTDLVLDTFLAIKGGDTTGGGNLDKLTAREVHQLADMMGWDSKLRAPWVADAMRRDAAEARARKACFEADDSRCLVDADPNYCG